MQQKNHQKLIHLPKIDSTNSEAIRRIKLGIPSGTAIFADTQTSGVGKLGRHFESELGGLYFSYIVDDTTSLVPVGLITSTAAVSVLECISEISSINAKIKWPNDIIVQGKKLCGILAIRHDNFTIVGIGINLMQKSFSQKIQEKAISLHMLTKAEYKNFIVAEILKSKLDKNFLEEFSKDKILSILSSKSDTLGKDVELAMPNGEVIKGFALEISPLGALILNANGILKEIYSAEIL